MNVSEQIVKALASAGVRHVFGVTGDAINFFVKAVLDHPEMEWVGVRHEENAAFAAAAQGQLGDTIGVCAGTVGPGALHLLNGLYNAKRERAPVLAVTGQVEQQHLGTGFFQETNLRSIFEDVCAYQAVIYQPEEAPRVILRAIQTALEQRAVARIELPAGVGRKKAGGERYWHPTIRSEARLTPGERSVSAAADLIDRSETITILAGAGCRGARQEVIDLAKKLQAPIVYTLRSADIFAQETPNLVGQTGLLGDPSGYQAVMKSDLLLMLGSDFPYVKYLPADTPTIQVDVRLANIGNRTAVDVGVHGDVKATVEQLLPRVKKRDNDAFLQQYVDHFTEVRKRRTEKVSTEHDHEPLHPQLFVHLLSRHAADDALLTLDTSTAVIWAARYLSLHGRRRLIGSFNHGSMGVALPAALGAQVLYPDRETWALVGDGGFTMSMQGFITAVNEQLPLKVIVFNNRELSLIKLEMEKAGQAPNLEASALQNPDFAEYARLCGGEGVQVKHADDIEAAILQAKKARVPFLIDAIVTEGEIPIPPSLSMGEAVKLAASKVKEAARALQGEQRHWKNILEELKAFLD